MARDALISNTEAVSFCSMDIYVLQIAFVIPISYSYISNSCLEMNSLQSSKDISRLLKVTLMRIIDTVQDYQIHRKPSDICVIPS